MTLMHAQQILAIPKLDNALIPAFPVTITTSVQMITAMPTLDAATPPFLAPHPPATPRCAIPYKDA